ncbi:MAG: 2-dehydropantoate 2-reductase [Eubacteriales bacterium]
MKIAMLGSGAMGMLYGGYLSQQHEVFMMARDPAKVDGMNQNGIQIEKLDGSVETYHPKAYLSGEELGEMDLVVLFVKAPHSRSALEENRSLIGKNTFLLTLQNGSGHQEILTEFAEKEKCVIGVTLLNSAILAPSFVRHGGTGATNIGVLFGDIASIAPISEAFNGCGIVTHVQENIKKLVWEKLFLNSSMSMLTGVLQVSMGYMGDNPHGNDLMRKLLHESVSVANAEGLDFEEEKVYEKVMAVLNENKGGLTSVYADMRDGRRTEVETLSGAVVRAGKAVGVETPSHAFLVSLIHAMEDIKA